jgi:hypothetical protein
MKLHNMQDGAIPITNGDGNGMGYSSRSGEGKTSEAYIDTRAM